MNIMMTKKQLKRKQMYCSVIDLLRSYFKVMVVDQSALASVILIIKGVNYCCMQVVQAYDILNRRTAKMPD